MTIFGSGRAVAEVAAGAQNTFTEAMQAGPGERVSVSISGTFTATVTLQRSFDDGITWRDYKTYTAADEDTYVVDETQWIRIGIKTGDYTSGTATVRLGKG